MKIAILSTPWIAVPPVGYGGIELVVANLCEGLVKRGHEVHLFATGDSETSAKLAYFYEKALGNDLDLKKNPYHLLSHVHAFFDYLKKNPGFDIIHNNAQFYPMYFLDVQDIPFVHTLHGAFYASLNSPSGLEASKRDLLAQFKHHPYVSISNQQREGMADLNYVSTVYNGIRPEKFTLGTGSGGYLAWLGRVTPNKGLDTSIEIARTTGLPLKIAAFIDEGEREYYEAKIKPLLGDGIEVIGEIRSHEEKVRFFADAKAFLFPIRWHEPFGLVMIEAMACGTPVIALDMGSVGEIVEDGKTGFVCKTTEEMVSSIARLAELDRNYIKSYVQKFSVDTMVDAYVQTYEKILE